MAEEADFDVEPEPLDADESGEIGNGGFAPSPMEEVVDNAVAEGGGRVSPSDGGDLPKVQPTVQVALDIMHDPSKRPYPGYRWDKLHKMWKKRCRGQRQDQKREAWKDSRGSNAR
eukprot:419452-Amphidinium_carterae.1